MSFKDFEKGIPTEKINRMIDERRRQERLQQEAKREREQAEMLEIQRFIFAGETLMLTHPELFERTPPPGGWPSLSMLKK